MIVSGFRAALELETYPFFIRPRCTERAKPGRGRLVLIMHIGFFACFHAIQCISRMQSFQQNCHINFHALACSTEAVGIAHKPLRSL